MSHRVRTTLMPRSFLAIDWPFSLMYLIVSQHQTVKPTSVSTPAMSIAVEPASSVGRWRDPEGAGDNHEWQVDHHHEDDAVEDRRAQPRAAIRGSGQRGWVGEIPDDGARRSVGICHE